MPALTLADVEIGYSPGNKHPGYHFLGVLRVGGPRRLGEVLFGVLEILRDSNSFQQDAALELLRRICDDLCIDDADDKHEAHRPTVFTTPTAAPGEAA